MSKPLRMKNIEMAFGELDVLCGLDLEVSAGEAVAVVGANGAGKTTLFKIAAGVLAPDRGQVYVQDDEIGTLARREVARRIAVVPQSSPPVFAFTLIEFVLMGYHARSTHYLPTGAQREGALQALQAMGLASRKERPIAELSGGEMQRALMARAMVAQAPLWLLDEPTASLDMHHQLSILTQVRHHVSQQGAALAILHDLALVHRFFDRVVVLFEGGVYAVGEPDEVLTSEVVSKVYGAEMKRGRVDGKVVWVAA